MTRSRRRRKRRSGMQRDGRARSLVASPMSTRMDPRPILPSMRSAITAGSLRNGRPQECRPRHGYRGGRHSHPPPRGRTPSPPVVRSPASSSFRRGAQGGETGGRPGRAAQSRCLDRSLRARGIRRFHVDFAAPAYFAQGRGLRTEILVLRQQINALRRNSPTRSVFRRFDRLVFVRLSPRSRHLGCAGPSSGPRPWFVGTGLDFDHSGVGNPDGAVVDRPIPLEIRRPIRGNEPGQPVLGRAPHPRRTAQARHRRRPDECCKIHGPEEGRAVTGLEDLSFPITLAASSRWTCSSCRHFPSGCCMASCLAAPSTSNHVAGGDGRPDG